MHTYCKQADCIVLCYSLTQKTSFQNLNEWLEELSLDERAKTLPVALIATKLDLAPDQRAVSEDEGYIKKEEIGDRCFIFRETTTFTDDTRPIQDLFINEIVSHVLNHRRSGSLLSQTGESGRVPVST